MTETKLALDDAVIFYTASGLKSVGSGVLSSANRNSGSFEFQSLLRKPISPSSLIAFRRPLRVDGSLCDLVGVISTAIYDRGEPRSGYAGAGYLVRDPRDASAFIDALAASSILLEEFFVEHVDQSDEVRPTIRKGANPNLLLPEVNDRDATIEHIIGGSQSAFAAIMERKPEDHGEEMFLLTRQSRMTETFISVTEDPCEELDELTAEILSSAQAESERIEQEIYFTSAVERIVVEFVENERIQHEREVEALSSRIHKIELDNIELWRKNDSLAAAITQLVQNIENTNVTTSNPSRKIDDTQTSKIDVGKVAKINTHLSTEDIQRTLYWCAKALTMLLLLPFRPLRWLLSWVKSFKWDSRPFGTLAEVFVAMFVTGVVLWAFIPFYFGASPLDYWPSLSSEAEFEGAASDVPDASTFPQVGGSVDGEFRSVEESESQRFCAALDSSDLNDPEVSKYVQALNLVGVCSKKNPDCPDADLYKDLLRTFQEYGFNERELHDYLWHDGEQCASTEGD